MREVGRCYLHLAWEMPKLNLLALQEANELRCWDGTTEQESLKFLAAELAKGLRLLFDFYPLADHRHQQVMRHRDDGPIR